MRALAFSLFLLVACSGEPTNPPVLDAGPEAGRDMLEVSIDATCTPGTARSCPCAAGVATNQGTQTCLPSGTYDACVCACAPGTSRPCPCPGGEGAQPCIDGAYEACRCGGPPPDADAAADVVPPADVPTERGACDSCRLNETCCGIGCADLQGDTANCGECGRTCRTAHVSVASCAGGRCSVIACVEGFANCDGDPANGCESQRSSDPNNCGDCGTVCRFANATPTCVEGRCALGACNAGFHDCDGNPANGCEATLDTPANCGVCGHRCTGSSEELLSTQTVAVCERGVCSYSYCPSGSGNCDRNPANGCEVDAATFATSAEHCGRCNNRCPMGFTCRGRSCS